MANVVIIGGGAAGCFCASELSSLHPGWHISVLEAGARPMAKLAVTGGGRCNLTNTFKGVQSLAEVYPRGDKVMRKLLGRFGSEDTCRWFESRGVQLTVQDDQCIFPASQDAMQIVHTLEKQMRHGGVRIYCNCKVTGISPGLTVTTGREGLPPFHPDAVVLASGGGTAGMLSGTGTVLIPPVPSLFTLKTSDQGLHALMGTVVDNVGLGIAGTRFRSTGTLLLTDWGVSGPAALRLSSYAARHLAESGYRGKLLVNWTGCEEQEVAEMLRKLQSSRMVVNSHPAAISDRLWRHLVSRAQIREDCRWGELGSKGLARLTNILISDSYEITGRARWKEEFVTCGGVALTEIKPTTMESRRIPGLFFAGEVLDIDAVTGGFNLQAAWTTAWVAAHGM